MTTTIKRNFLAAMLAVALFTVPAFAGDMGGGGFTDAGTSSRTSSSVTGDMGGGGLAANQSEPTYLDWVLGSIDEYLDWVR